MIYNDMTEFLQECHGLQKDRRGDVVLVATSGAFDILHRGHLKMLRLCRRLGTRVVVLLNTDESIQAYKSEHRPVKDWQTRADLLDELECVDYVVGLRDPTPTLDLAELKPDIFVKGDRPINEIVEKEALFDVDSDIVILWNHEHGSSTDLIAKAAQVWHAERDINLASRQPGGNDSDSPREQE